MFNVCVYAICKNESKNIDRWYESVKDADIIYLLDTGSEDNTVELIKNYPAIKSSQFIQEGDFDFSVARNEALKRARNFCGGDQWVFVSLDLDEFLQEGGIQKIRESWSSDYDTLRMIGCTKGEPGQSVDHKVHSNADWSWHRSIHEIICLPDKVQADWVVGNNTDIFYVHEQDLTKNRDYYEKLLLDYEKNPDDIKTTIYLAWESYNHEKWEDYLEYSLKCIDLIKNNTEDEFYMNYEYLLQCYINCAQYHSMMEQHAVADMYLNYAMRIVNEGKFPPFRRLYYLKAKVQWELEQKEIAISYYKKCLTVKERPYCWIDEDEYYDDSRIYTEISNGYYYFSQPQEALAYAEIAYSLDPENETLRNNVEIIRNTFTDYIFPEKKNKICVYAICKNEEQFVEAWLESMNEADYIVVLDTGSTDNTFELLKNDPRVYRAEQKVITPWRFDTARNESMKLIPDDANILLSTDLDELLEPGWADVIRENWIDGFHVRGTYKYAWSHTEDGQPGRIFYYDKLHDKNWYWTAPVHELLHSDLYSDEYRFEHSIDLFEKGVYLHHYPDHTKSRGSYLPLLELRAKEDPEDYYGKFYLSHEYNYRGYYEKSNEVLLDILKNYKDKYSNLEIAAAYLFLGDNHRSMGDPDKAIYYYNLSIAQEPSYREPYLLAAEICNERKNCNMAMGYVFEALAKSYRHFTWIERDNSWNEQADDILAVAYYWTGNKELALQHAEKAVELNPHDERLQQNLEFIKNM
jgi:tetratricopeptide (TPR) repeat protein